MKKSILFSFIFLFPFYLDAKAIFKGVYTVKKGENLLGEERFKIEMGDKSGFIYGASIFIPAENLGKKKEEDKWSVRTYIELSSKGKFVKFKRWTREKKEIKYQIVFIHKKDLKMRTEYGGNVSVENIAPAEGVFIFELDVYYLLNIFKYYSFFTEKLETITLFFPYIKKKKETKIDFSKILVNEETLTKLSISEQGEAFFDNKGIMTKGNFGEITIAIKK